MELSKADTLIAKGVAILGMVMLHLFCRLGNLPYSPLFYFADTPIIYYLGLFGDLCVPIYCFCSGYANHLIWSRDPSAYSKRIPVKILSLLKNYWVVVVLFSLLGFFFAPDSGIPGSFSTFMGNILLFRMNYNGSWWFVVTYLFLLVFSPAISGFVSKARTWIILLISFSFYFIAYFFRFIHPLTLTHPIPNWFWQQFVLFGTSLFPYVAGSLCYQKLWISRLRLWLQTDNSPLPSCRRYFRFTVIYILPFLAFSGHCIVQSVFVAPFTAAAVLLSLFISKLPRWFIHVFSCLGKHSTNIWLAHMFFYLSMFPGLVFRAKYPLLILLFMMTLCFACSVAIRTICALFDRGFGKLLHQ